MSVYVAARTEIPDAIPPVVLRGKEIEVTVRVHVTRDGNGMYVAQSPDLPGLFWWGRSLGALRADVPLIARELMKLNQGLLLEVGS